jgi:hypothetical protein
MADRPLTNRNNAIVDKHYAFGKLDPEKDPNPPVLDASVRVNVGGVLRC